MPGLAGVLDDSGIERLLEYIYSDATDLPVWDASRITASRDGGISMFDSYNLATVAEIRAGINTRNVADPGDGSVLMWQITCRKR